MKDDVADSRQKTILNAAWNAFAAYGYRKTSMDDIARGAAMSRPALYLHYRSKQDIFRSLAQYYYDGAATAVENALARSGPPEDLLAGAFKAQGGEVFEVMLSSPHGMELLDATSQTAADIVLSGEARLQTIYAIWLTRLEEAGQAQFPGSADDVAATILASLKGIKKAGADYATYLTRLRILAQMIGAGLITAQR